MDLSGGNNEQLPREEKSNSEEDVGNQQPRNAADEQLIICMEKGCESTQGRTFESFQRLAEHASLTHGRAIVEVPIATDTNLKFRVDKSFFEDISSSKFQIVSRVNVVDEFKESFQVAFLLTADFSPSLYDKGTPTTCYQIIPVNENEDRLDLIDVEIQLADDNDTHQRFTQIASFSKMKNMVKSTNPLCLSKTKLLQFHDELLQHDLFQFTIRVNIQAYRVSPMSGKPTYLNKYAESWDELHLSHDMKSILKSKWKNSDDPPAIFKVLIPQFCRTDDLIVECTDVEGIFRCVAAETLDYAFFWSKEQPRKVSIRCIIVYANSACVEQQQLKWKELSDALDLSVVSMPTYEEEIKKQIMEIGCHILITTLDAVNTLIRNEDDNSIEYLMGNLTFVVHFDVDIQVEKDNGFALTKFQSSIPAVVGLVRVAICPAVNLKLVDLLYQCRFNLNTCVISLGVRPEAIIAKLDVATYTEVDPEHVNAIVIRWLNFQDESKWLIVMDSEHEYVHGEILETHSNRIYNEHVDQSATILSVKTEDLVSAGVRLPGAGIFFVSLPTDKPSIIRAFTIIQQRKGASESDMEYGFFLGFRVREPDKLEFCSSIFVQ